MEEIFLIGERVTTDFSKFIELLMNTELWKSLDYSNNTLKDLCKGLSIQIQNHNQLLDWEPNYHSRSHFKDVCIALSLLLQSQAAFTNSPAAHRALSISAKNALPSYIALQDHYNLVHRKPFESEQAPVLAANGLGSFPFYGLARGFLSGKYSPGVKIESVRAEGVAEFYSDQNWKIIDALREIAQARSAPVSAIALAWLRSHPQVCAPIASARTPTQLEEIVQVIELTPAEVEKLNAVSA